jgi:glycosyltransferase involved in cell wall biosynthesis
MRATIAEPTRSPSDNADVARSPAVLMVTGAYFPELSGGGLQARAVVRALAGRARFTVLTTSIDPSLPARASEDGVPIYRIYVDPRHALSRIWATLRLTAALFALRRHVDIVNLHGFSKKAVLIALFCRLFRKPYVLTLQTGGHDEPAGARTQGRLTAWAYGAADRYLSVSPGLSAAYRAAALPADRLRQVSNAVDVDRFRPARLGERDEIRDQLDLPRDRCLILFVGFFGRDKRPDWLFDAWAALPAPVRSRSGLVFVGRTDAAHAEVDARLASAIRASAAHHGVERSIWFVESTLEIERYFRACDMYALPSIREGLPIALLEAMATGLACIATSIAGSTDTLLEHRGTGWLVPADDGSAWTAALQTLISDEEERRRCGAAAREVIVSKYAINATAPLWLAEYRALARHA